MKESFSIEELEPLLIGLYGVGASVVGMPKSLPELLALHTKAVDSENGSRRYEKK